MGNARYIGEASDTSDDGRRSAGALEPELLDGGLTGVGLEAEMYQGLFDNLTLLLDESDEPQWSSAWRMVGRWIATGRSRGWSAAEEQHGPAGEPTKKGAPPFGPETDWEVCV